MSGSSVITRSYRLDPETALATFVAALAGGVVPGAGDWQTGVDFNPVVDRLRLVNASNENYRINPNSGLLTGNDSNLTFTAPATGPVTAVAYDRNVAPGPPGTVAPPGTLTTLYGVDVGSDRLVVQGGINGAGPGGANGGAITPIGPLGVVVDDTQRRGLRHLARRRRVCRPAHGERAEPLHRQPPGPGKRPRSACCPPTSRSLTILPPAPPAPAPGDADGDGVNDAADACPTLAGPAPSGCPPPADITQPGVTVGGVPGRVSLKRFLARHLGADHAERAREPRGALCSGARRGARIARVGDLVLAERRLVLSAAARRVRLKPSRRLVARAKRVQRPPARDRHRRRRQPRRTVVRTHPVRRAAR